MNAVVKPVNDAALRTAEFDAAVEVGLATEQMLRLLGRPLTVGEFINPTLIVAGVDFARLTRVQKAIDLLRANGITEIPDHSARTSYPPMITVDACEASLNQARELASKFDAVNKRGGAKR